MFTLTVIHIITTLLLAMYGFNAWFLLILFPIQWRRSQSQPSPIPKSNLPPVTIQLPVFNELYVVERLIDAVVRLDYPAHLLQIQLLDDSTDETTEIALARVKHYQKQGINIDLIHRQKRTGFKAGALNQGVQQATGEFIAVFDADFIPKPDFLRQTIPHLVANSELGFVQARWEHLNREYSWITAAQSLALDGHFVVEQTTRNRTGFLINFNGTAGVWRRTCIESAGGWQGDTISEDFDLSYRAQMEGWKALYLPDVVAPAEVPPQLGAFKRQQARWTKGCVQCLKKLGWRMLLSRLPWPQKVQGFIHISSCLVHVGMTIQAIIAPIFIIGNGAANIRFPLAYLSLAILGPPFLFAASQIALYRSSWWRTYRAMGILIFLGIGIALNNTKAAIEGLLGIDHVFRRTPKFNVRTISDHWQNNIYRLPIDWLVIGELVLSLYLWIGIIIATVMGHYFSVPFLLLYALGFGYVGLQGLWDARLEWKNWLRFRLRGKKANPPKTSQRKLWGTEQ